MENLGLLIWWAIGTGYTDYLSSVWYAVVIGQPVSFIVGTVLMFIFFRYILLQEKQQHSSAGKIKQVDVYFGVAQLPTTETYADILVLFTNIMHECTYSKIILYIFVHNNIYLKFIIHI